MGKTSKQRQEGTLSVSRLFSICKATRNFEFSSQQIVIIYNFLCVLVYAFLSLYTRFLFPFRLHVVNFILSYYKHLYVFACTKHLFYISAAHIEIIYCPISLWVKTAPSIPFLAFTSSVKQKCGQSNSTSEQSSR